MCHVTRHEPFCVHWGSWLRIAVSNRMSSNTFQLVLSYDMTACLQERLFHPLASYKDDALSIYVNQYC